jgi:hypothetical protein
MATTLTISQRGNLAVLNWTTLDDTSGSPGPSILAAGNMTAGYFGTVTSAQLITGDALCSLIGLSAGTSQYSTTDWLKFASDGKVIFVAKKPIRYGLSWNAINAVGAVYGRPVEIGGLSYSVRLMRGAESDPAAWTDSDRDAKGSEWNKLMLPIHVNAPSTWPYPEYVDSPTEDWGINLTNEDLLIENTYGNGSATICQEIRDNAANGRVFRGYNDVSYAYSGLDNIAYDYCGYRPVLEVVM